MKIKKIFLLLILISGVRSAKPLFQEVAAIGLASASIVFGCTFNTEPFSAMSNEQKLVLIFLIKFI